MHGKPHLLYLHRNDFSSVISMPHPPIQSSTTEHLTFSDQVIAQEKYVGKYTLLSTLAKKEGQLLGG
jgi:hypothetical protein